MIEQGLLTFVSASAVGISVEGKVYYHRVPSDIKLPWIRFSAAGGPETKITQMGKIEADVDFLFVVDDDQQFRGRAIVEDLKALLQNYRGNLPPERDALITCSAIKDIDGPNGVFSYVLPVRVRYDYYDTYA